MKYASLLALGLFPCSLTLAVSITRQVQLGSNQYFLPPTAVWKLDAWGDGDSEKEEFTPLTVVDLNSTASLPAVFDHYAADDDVWTPEFAEVLYIQTNQNLQQSDLRHQLNATYHVTSIFTSAPNETHAAVPSGPYFVHSYTGNVYQAYKLYVDTNQAFIQSSYQDSQGNHNTLSAASPSAGGLTIAVPSRLYFTPTKEKPLAGLRIAVKDLYDLKGMKTSGGNRALFEISGIKAQTAVPVQKLIDAGAIIVGKNKLSEFAFAGPYVTEHIDYLLPFNPRGDGYNSPGDSSGGSAASVASYDWLDASMGSDTGGSIRGPAATNGVHGGRPTQNAVNLTGALPLSPAMDTAGILARNPITFSTVSKALYSESLRTFQQYPTSILLDKTFMQLQVANQYPQLEAVVSNFVTSLSNLTSASVSKFDVDQAFNKTAITGFENTPPADLISGIYGNLTSYEQFDLFGRDFIESYMSTHNGAFPHMSPGTRQGWMDANRTQTPATHAQTLQNKQAFTNWVTENFLKSDDKTCSSALYLYLNIPAFSNIYKPDVSQDEANPFVENLTNKSNGQAQTILMLNSTLECNTTLGEPAACNAALESLSQTPSPPTVAPSRIASLAGLPDYAITLGSLDLGSITLSNSSLQTQNLPFTVDIVAAPGCDGLILDVVEQLFDRGVIPEAKTGIIV